MAKDKKSFILYCDLIQEVDHLTDEEKGKLFQHLLEYVNDMNPVMDDRVILGSWKHIQRQLKRDLEKYEGIKEKRSEAGKKSAEKRKQEAANPTSVESVKHRSANPTVNDTVNVSVNDILLEKETKELFKAWIDYRKEIKKPIKAESTRISLAKKIKAEGFEKSKQVIDASIQNGYQGLFWDSKQSNTKEDNGNHIDYTKVEYP